MTIDKEEKKKEETTEQPAGPLKEDDSIAFYSTIETETLRLEWTATPNWLRHPLLFALAKGAISSHTIKNSIVVHITRKTFWRIFSIFLVKELEAFEDAMTEQGINIRAELLAFFKQELRCIPNPKDSEFLGMELITGANRQPKSEEEQP